MLWDPVMDNPPPAISFIILRRWDSQSPKSWWKSETQTCGNLSAVTFLNLKHCSSQQLCLSLILSFCVAFYSVNPTTFPKSQQYISRGKEKKRLEMRLFFFFFFKRSFVCIIASLHVSTGCTQLHSFVLSIILFDVFPR